MSFRFFGLPPAEFCVSYSSMRLRKSSSSPSGTRTTAT